MERSCNMDKTQNYSLQKPLSVEKYSISIHNMNMDLIDSALKRIEQKNESQDNLLATKESLNAEISRATTKESSIESRLNSEVSRAQSAESNISTNLENEVSRATTAESNINSELSGHKSNESNPHNVTKSQVGLGNADNTSDIDKPVSTAQQNALDLKAPLESPILTGIPKAPTAPNETNTTQVATTAFTQTSVSNHNISESAHSDIRALISGLTTRLNTLADSDDTTLDQLSEIVAYIKNNKDLIDGITTTKVNVSDIIDDLTSADPEKPLSSNQGRILNGLITDLIAIVQDKVDKVSGKELSTNDFTNEYKNKLESVSSGAQVNVQSDWNITDATSDAFIKNKPTSMPASDVSDWAKADTKPTYTKSEIGLENVENKSSATIRSELTKENVTNALGYTPPTTNTTYSASNTIPKANGTANTGTESDYARGDHVHPSQTSVSGNAGTSTKWATARNIDGMLVRGDANRTTYGTCSTAATTADKVVACDGFALVIGAKIDVKFTVTNTAANPTLNVNNSGAKPIYYRGSAISAGYLATNRTYSFRYNGTQWDLVGDLDTNTTYGVVSTSANGLCPKRTGTTTKFLRDDGTWAVPTGGAGITYSDTEPTTLTDGMTWIGAK